ncbi:sensory box sensor histidine kinase [Chitinispirillum alkaliphilum]|nr:sensory box sensor histidine kinase [Chitinispirillum alkaliphilum]
MKLFKIFTPSKSLKFTLITHIVLPLTVAFGLFGYFAFSSIEEQVEYQMQKDLELMARAIQQPLSYSLEKDRMGSVQQTLESVFAIGRVYGAYVYDKEGREIAKQGLTDPNPERQKLIQLAAEGENHGEYDRIAGRRVFSYFLPLTDTGGKIHGLLHLTRRGSDFRDHLASVRLKGIIGLSLLLIILSIIILYGHHRALGRHLNRFTSSMFRIANGDSKHRFDCSGPEEIVKLGTNFNSMLDSIEHAEQKLKRHQDDQKKLEEKLRQAERLASLGRFCAGTAHELGTPLSVINGKAQRAMRCKEISQNQYKTLSAIRDEVGRMKYIIRQLLDFSHRSPLHRTSVCPTDLFTSVISALQEEIANTNIKLSEPDIKTNTRVDAIRIQQALLNLVRNAVQSTPGGNVNCSWNLKNNNVVFFIDDDGPGIPKEIYPKIFEPFFTTKTVGKGTGLGLSVVHTIIEEHEGKIEVKESKMGGTCFEISIPHKN